MGANSIARRTEAIAASGDGKRGPGLQNGRKSQAWKKGPSAAMTAVSWMPTETLDVDRWVEFGRRLGVLGRGVAWWLGDWLNYGNAHYGEKYARAAHITGYDSQTLMNMAYVASRFDASRRRQALSWSHHAEVAALDDADQDYWLDLAERERLAVHCLRLELRSAGRGARGLDSRRSTGSRGTAGQIGINSGEDQVTGESGVICPSCGEPFQAASEDGTRSLP